MRFIDFFAGIGGARRGMELAGNICAGFCEVDNFAAAAYTSMHLITDEQRKYLATLPKHKRRKEILKSEYRNGEWYSDDVRRLRGRDLPVVECWCFGAPCQDFSIAGLRAGLGGDKSSLVREIFRLIGEVGEENKPEWLIYENVKGMLSSNRGLDFAFILAELDERGYDAEWRIFNSKDYGVPQNRERVYVVGHLRRKGTAKVFPITETIGENNIQIIQLGRLNTHRENKNQYRVYSSCGIAPTLNSMEGGGREPHIILQLQSGVIGDIAANTNLYSIPVDKDKTEGIIVKIEGEDVYAIWHELSNSYIAVRKLTPKECFRLQGWNDEYYEKAAFINSDSQLYKEAGNGITVNVIHSIAEMIKEVICENS